MSTYNWQTLRWPFDVQSPHNAFTLRNIPGAVDDTQNLTAGTYIVDGSGAVIAPKDLCAALNAAFVAALTALGVTGTLIAALGADGRITFTQAGGNKTIAIKNLSSIQQGWLGIATAQISGGLFNIPSNSSITATYQAGCQWHPGIDADHDSGNVQKILASEGKNLLGDPRRVVRSSGTWRDRRLAWSFIASARILDSRAESAAYADFADISQNEPNTWENLWEYLLGVRGPYGDNRVYLYSSNDPALATNYGAYHYRLSESKPGLEGVDLGGYVGGFSIEHFEVYMVLKKI